jgi:hypothetical protein
MTPAFEINDGNDLSPNGMANDALAAAVADRIRRSNIDHDDDQMLVVNRVKFNSSETSAPNELEDEISMAEDHKTGAERQIDDIWKKMQLTSTQTAPQNDYMQVKYSASI